jgi:cellulose 1,4-beta-cellobiosidase
LTWNPVGTAQAYWVKRATMDGGPYLEVASVAGTNFTDSGLVNGTTYYYVVTATNQVGESEHSEQVAATPQAVIPAAPEGLAAVSGDAQVTLSWSTVSGSTSYHIKRSTVEGGPYSQIGEATETHYVDTTAQNGVLYFYVVTAVNSNGESPDSKAASAMPQISAPGVPTGLTATVTNGSVILEWNMTLTATNYSVKRATSSAGPFTVIHSGPLVTFTDSQISDGVRYYYTVSASNAGGESSDCTPVSVTAQSQLTLNVSILSDGRILLSWPLWAVDYKVMSTGDLSVSTWQPITNVVNTTASAFEVVVPTSPSNAFFRLQK